MSHPRRARFAAAATAIALLATMAACSGDDAEPAATGSTSSGAEAPSGEILVLTNRTDLVDTVFQDYKKTFEEKYPEVTVQFEALTDYEGEVKTRMSTTDYGDVLGIPGSVPVQDYPDFFEPLGATDELGEKYRFINEAALDGTAYGLATFGNASGFVYNKDVFEEAGVADLPTTPEEFMAAMQAIKDKTDATPLYTNYKDGWPLDWPQQFMGSVSGDAEASAKMAEEDAPWADGQEKAQLDSLLYNVAEAGLIEDDPTTTNWENSKNLIATGKIGVMGLGSWAIPQMQEAAETAGSDPASIGFMPAPFQADGKFHAPIAGDFKIGININSEHKAAARAWIDWFVEDSGFYEQSGALPTVVGVPAPAVLEDFEATGVEYLEMVPSEKLSAVDSQSEIGLRQPDYYRNLIDSARGALGQSKEEIFTSLDEKWAAARESVG